MSGTMIPKELLPLIGKYLSPSIDEFCSSLTMSEKKTVLKKIIDSHEYHSRGWEYCIQNMWLSKRQRLYNIADSKDDCLEVLKLSDDNIKQLPFLGEKLFNCELQTDEATMRLVVIYEIQQYADADLEVEIRVILDDNDIPVDVCVYVDNDCRYSYSTNVISEVQPSIDSIFRTTVQQAKQLGDFIEENRLRGVYNEN